MILTVVGSGTLVPNAQRTTPSLMVQTHESQFSIDGGSGTLRRQAEFGIDFRNTHWLLYTHVHPDHSLDLLHFLFASSYTPGFDRKRPLELVGPRGFENFVEQYRDGILSWTKGGDPGFAVTELDHQESHAFGDVRVTALKLNHSITNMGYRVEDKQGRSFAFTGDTAWCEELVDLARNVDVLVAECSGDEAHTLDGHLSAPEVGRLAAEAKVKQVVLTHLYPLPNDRGRIAEVARSYAGPILLARDGDRFMV